MRPKIQKPDTRTSSIGFKIVEAEGHKGDSLKFTFKSWDEAEAFFSDCLEAIQDAKK